jgi:ribosomal protein L16/L10AE
LHDIQFFQKQVTFFSKDTLSFTLASQNLSFQKNLKRTISKKVNLNFLSPVFLNMFKKPAQVRMGNGKGQKLNKQIHRFVYGQPLFSSRRLKVKSALKVKRKIRSKLGVSTRVLNFRNFFFSV